MARIYVHTPNGKTVAAISLKQRQNQSQNPFPFSFLPPWRAEVEGRLAVVIAQEEEVRTIADEYLEREGHLTELLEDLYRQQKVGFQLQPPYRRLT